MTSLCSAETVIIGHAVQNDLVSLQMDHRTVVDSALLFPVEGAESPRIVCSLKDLATNVLGRDMPETHDSVNDARVTLACVEEGWRKVVVEKGREVKPIVRS